MPSRRELGVIILTVCFFFLPVCHGISTAILSTETTIYERTGGTQETSTNDSPTTKPTTETATTIITTTGRAIVTTKDSTQKTSTNESPTTKPTTETATTIITTTGRAIVTTKDSTQKTSTNESTTTTTTSIESTSDDSTTQDNKVPPSTTNIDAKITSTLYSTMGPLTTTAATTSAATLTTAATTTTLTPTPTTATKKGTLTTQQTNTNPPKQDSIETSGVNVKLEISSDEFDDATFKRVIAENTKAYCTDEKCKDNYEYISSDDVIIYYKGSKPYFEVNTENDILADGELHVSFYVKDHYTDTLTVMNTEQATAMLNEQQNNIQENLGYDFEIQTPNENSTGFPGWATSLIVFCVICVFVVIYVFWRAKKLEEKKSKYGIELGDLEKGTQATQAEIIAEMNRDRHEENAYEKINEPNETNAAIQTRYGDIIAETGAPAVEKYLNKSLSDKNKSATNGHVCVAEEAEPSSKPDKNIDDKPNGKLSDTTPMPPPPPPPVEFSEVDVHRDDWQKDDFPEPPTSPLDLDVAAEEATSELVNLVKEQTAELESTGIDNQGFQPDDGTIRTEL